MWELLKNGRCEAHMHIVECFLVLWCTSMCLGAYLVIVVHYGLIICFVDESLHCEITPYIEVKVCEW